MRSVCILRLSALGDVTHVLPTVEALRERHPGVAISWIIGRLEHRLLAGLPGVEFLVFDKSRGARAYADLRRRLAGRRFDLLLHMQIALRANLAAWQVRARRRVGYDRARSREGHGLRLTDRIPADAGPHVLDVLSSFLVPVDGRPAPPRWTLPLAPADHAFARAHLPPPHRHLVITPCSSHRLRNWRAERYAAVADHFCAHGWRVTLCGGPSEFERAMAGAIERAARHGLENLTGKDTLPQLAALLARADLVLAPDTGPAHIANAVGTPVLGLYAATDPRRSGPYHSVARCVDRYADAARKLLGREPEELRWGTKIEAAGVMDLITVDDVLEKAASFLN